MSDDKKQDSIGNGIAWAGFWLALGFAYGVDKIASAL